MTAKRAWTGLFVWMAAVFAAPVIGGLLGGVGGEKWYTQPSWAPPDWVFGPVWTALYISMAVAAWLVWSRKGFRGARAALWLFIVQLALNAAWTPVFFGLRNAGAAFVVIVALWLAILATILAFRRERPLAALVMTPYALWVTFAAALNFEIWRLNA